MSLQSYYEAFRATVADRCRGIRCSGWHLSDLDTFHACPCGEGHGVDPYEGEITSEYYPRYAVILDCDGERGYVGDWRSFKTAATVAKAHAGASTVVRVNSEEHAKTLGSREVFDNFVTSYDDGESFNEYHRQRLWVVTGPLGQRPSWAREYCTDLGTAHEWERAYGSGFTVREVVSVLDLINIKFQIEKLEDWASD